MGLLQEVNEIGGAEQDGGGVGDLDFLSSQEFSWIGIKPF